MVETKERATGSPNVSRLAAELRPISADSRARRWRSPQPSLRTTPQVDAPVTPLVSRRRQIAHFVRHYFEMCVPMCVGFAVGDLVYFWAASRFGYSHPFK
ncbi:MAG: hypothetical protein ACXWCI_19715, partial [Caldimonas sp.]